MGSSFLLQDSEGTARLHIQSYTVIVDRMVWRKYFLLSPR